jgi:thiol:disulfide interchange protein DsbC
MFRLLLLALLAACSLSVSATEDALQISTDALHKVAPNAKVQSAVQSPLAGFYAVIADGHPIYVSADGKYLIEGHVFDLAAMHDVMEDTMTGVRKAMLDAIPADKKLTFAPPHPKYHLTVFTDVDCPYCRTFHKQIADYNKLGIAVDYVLYPLAIHPGSDKKAQTVWCAKDRNSAYTDAMNGANLPPKTCANPIAEISDIATAMGVNGTPAIFTAEGTQLGGYLPPDQLAQRLNQLASPAPPPTN